MPPSSTTGATLSCQERFKCQEALYKNTSDCVLHLPAKEKSADFTEALREKLRDGKFDFRGVWFPEKISFKEFTFNDAVSFRDATFSEEADFGSTTFEKSVTFRSATFSAEATFRSATFNAEANFRSVTFERPVTFRFATFGAAADFNSANFKLAANFGSRFMSKADFSETRFRNLAEFTRVNFEKEANFYSAKFLAISRFSDATFGRTTNFDAVTFQGGANFNSAVFAETVNFRGATFQDRVFFDDSTFTGEVSFLLANFKDYVRFRGYQVFSDESPPKFREVKFDKPGLASFHSLTLRPYWFVDVNASEFALTDVVWDWRLITIDREIDGIVKNFKDVLSPYPILGIACWNLAVNAEENHRYEEASKFRYLAMEARRRGTLFRNAYWRLHWREARPVLVGLIGSLRRDQKERRKILTETKLFWKSLWGSVGILHWLYWLLSGYGERIVRAFAVLIGIWLVFAGIYAATGATLGWGALTHSAAVMMLQRPEPPAPTAAGQGVVILEMILAPVQAALLALAIRRKFMR